MSFSKRNRASLTVAVAAIFFLSLFHLPSYAKSADTIKIQYDRVSLNIKDAPLNDILKTIAEQSGIVIVFSGDIHRKVSLNLSNISIEDALKRLLSGSNFTFIYQKISSTSGTPAIIMKKVVVVSDKESSEALRFGPKPDVAALAPAEDTVPEESVDVVKRDIPMHKPLNEEPTEFPRVGDGIFVKASRRHLSMVTATDLSTQFSGQTANLRLGLSGELNPPEGDKTPEDITGVQISSITKGSIMEQLGLKSGDVVSDINGTRITQPDQVVSVLHSAFEDIGGIRIEVERGNVIEPIYVEME